MNIQILYDNEAVGKQFKSGWGFSCLVDEYVLFDTGADGEALLFNMQQFNVDFEKIKAIVISHDHWDHTGGLEAVLKKKKGLPVYVCPGFSEELKNRIKSLGGECCETGGFRKIIRNICVTKNLPMTYKGTAMEEQALVVKTSSGISVLTGCAHPGIVNIVKNIEEYFSCGSFYIVLGGFHLGKKTTKEIESTIKQMRLLKVSKLGPAHCTGEEAKRLMKKEYGDHFMSIKAGVTVHA